MDSVELYRVDYYRSYCGSVPYDRSHPHRAQFFGNVADELIRTLRPRRVFDAGCAMGCPVEALWDRGVEASGRDVSELAISEVRTDVRSYCSVGSLTQPIEGHFDLATCIEVLEHMSADEGEQAIASRVAAADQIVFSSSPDDFEEPTYVNVKPAIYWIRTFTKYSFAPLIGVTHAS